MITMLGGFMGVMGFIGALVFWDRRTFMKRAREEMRSEVAGDRNKMEGIVAALKKVGEKFPEVSEVLRSFGAALGLRAGKIHHRATPVPSAGATGQAEGTEKKQQKPL